jgi:hypothetical protein
MVMNFLDAAAGLVSLGFRVFPLVPGKNLPLVKEWPKVATDDADVIGEWAARWPNANIGVATGEASGVMVVDLDVKDGRNGLENLAALARTGKVLPPSPVALTPSGGRHLYFRAVPGVRNVVGITAAGRGLALGIDVRAEGGFVVAPPSERANGRYRWLVPPMTPAFPRLPDWGVKMLLPPPQKTRTASPDVRVGDIAPLTRFVANSPDGQRNNALFWATCRVAEHVAADRNVSAQAAKDQLAKAAEDAGLPTDEATKTINSGFRASGRQP